MWDEVRGLLHWVDIPAGAVHSSSLQSGVTSTSRLSWSVGAVALLTGDGLVCATEVGFGILDAGLMRMQLGYERPGERMNDAKVDPAGRLWAGSTAVDFRPGGGAVHVIDSDWGHRVAISGLTLPNGMDWSPDGTVFYLVDTFQHVLYAYEFSVADGSLGQRRELLTVPSAWGLPDGLTVDAAGGLWLALWGGSRVLSISPDGAVLGSIDVPVRQPSSCAFGRDDYRTLFISTARQGLDLPVDAIDGSMLAVEIDGVRGRPASVFGAAR